MAEYIETESADLDCIPTEAESSVAAHIAARPQGDFEVASEEGVPFGVFFHLSPMRESVLNWYPFERGSVALEIGGDMGALTGLLCARCARVVSVEKKAFKAKAIAARHSGERNLTVIGGDVARLFPRGGRGETRALPRAFDYVIALDPERFAPDYMEGLFDLLTPRGRLLLATENRFALRYWCGKGGPKTGLPFASLAGREHLIAKAELSRRLSGAGFAGQKWYYPLTDHLFAQDIYSESLRPNRFLNTRLFPYSKSDSALLLREEDLYGDVIAGGAFEFMCNAYLVEARKRAGDAPCDVDYATLTTHRSADKRFATTVHADGTARKTALRREGVRRLENLAKNHAALRARGIDALPVRLSGNAAIMPRVPHETLWDYWQGRLREGRCDEEAFIRIFDRLRDCIAASSDCEPPGASGWDPRLGPVQKTAYPELVPANCFYDPEKDTLTFFDQEYARAHCPASVPLSRALLCLSYSPLFSSDARTADLLPLLIARYGLTECWPLLEDIETEFLRAVFNFESTRVLERETEKARGIVRRNCEAIAWVKYISDRWKRIGVYGYGKRGKRLCALLRAAGSEIAFLIDRDAATQAENGAAFPQPRIYADFDAVRGVSACDVIVVTPRAEADAIAARLRERSGCPVVTLDAITGETA